MVDSLLKERYHNLLMFETRLWLRSMPEDPIIPLKTPITSSTVNPISMSGSGSSLLQSSAGQPAIFDIQDAM